MNCIKDSGTDEVCMYEGTGFNYVEHLKVRLIAKTTSDDCTLLYLTHIENVGSFSPLWHPNCLWAFSDQEVLSCG